MGEDYFDVVALGSETVILYGTRADHSQFYRPLTEEERERVYRLTNKHDVERDRLLRELASSPEQMAKLS